MGYSNKYEDDCDDDDNNNCEQEIKHTVVETHTVCKPATQSYWRLQECGDSPPEGKILYAEFLANIIFAFGAVYSNLSFDTTTGILVSPISSQNKLSFVADSHGMALFVAVALLGHLSAHCNPMVTLLFALLKSITWMRALKLWIAQILAWSVVLGIALAFYGQSAIAAAAPSVGVGFNAVQAFFGEAIGTFLLVMVVALFMKRLEQRLAIGVTLAYAMRIFLPISSAALNPWRAYFPMLFSLTGTSDWWVYLFGELLGTLVAYGFFAMRFDKYGGSGPPVCEEVCDKQEQQQYQQAPYVLDQRRQQ